MQRRAVTIFRFFKSGMIRNITYQCLRVRHFNTCSVSRQPYTPKDNSGIYRRLKLISENEPDIENANMDYQSLEELEENIMEADRLNKEMLSEIKSNARLKDFKITERKYFKSPKEPGMLTWPEKEQIRFLHQKDPEQWTPEILAESFPASPAIIKKILKAKWRPSSVEAMKAHDQKVSENWIAFHRGKLEVHDPKLKAHLAKFTDRKNGVSIISDEEAKRATEVILPKPKRTEFLSLVTSFKSKNENENTDTCDQMLEENIQPPRQIGNENVDNILDRSNTYYTLDQYRKRLTDQMENFTETQEDIKAIINRGKTDDSVTETSSSQTYVAPSERFMPNAIAYQKRKESKLTLIDPENLPNQIAIPPEKWKPGLVYRVNDCFYNDRGYFLYRVPGLKAE